MADYYRSVTYVGVTADLAVRSHQQGTGRRLCLLR